MTIMEVYLAIDMEVYLAIDMEVVFNQMKNDLLSKWFRVAIDCDRSQVDAK